MNLFVERQHLLYKPQDVQDWLLEGCQVTLAMASAGDAVQGVSVSDWQCVCSSAFPPSDRNDFRLDQSISSSVSPSHLHLYDFSDEINRLPEDVLQGGGAGEALADIEARMAAEIERGGVSFC